MTSATAPVTLTRCVSPTSESSVVCVATAVWPDYDEYQARTERDIPVVIVERVS